MNKLLSALQKPLLYTKTEGAFWDDEYISEQMLKAHLDPEFEGASRKHCFIEKSSVWIQETVSPLEYPRLLDVGCGPGLYAQRFAKAGYQVTGVDFSRSSLTYARKAAQIAGLPVTYRNQDYLKLDLKEQFDFAVMIYCDYGALSDTDRKILLNRLHNHLRPGGKLLLDVFSETWNQRFQECQKWELCSRGGFWSPEEYAAFTGRYRYPGLTTLDMTVIVTETELKPYYLWNTCFNEETLIQEIESAGFKVCGVFGDVAGSCMNSESETLAVLLQRH